jgi:hypothetical protein
VPCDAFDMLPQATGGVVVLDQSPVLLQDVVKATKADDGLVAVANKIKKLRSVIGSIEEQLDSLEAAQKTPRSQVVQS